MVGETVIRSSSSGENTGQYSESLTIGSPFAESEPIHQKLAAFFSILVELVGRDLPEFKDVLAASTAREPVLRHSLETYLNDLRRRRADSIGRLRSVIAGTQFPPDPASAEPDSRFGLVSALPGHSMRVLATMDPADHWLERLLGLFADAFGGTEGYCDVVPAGPSDIAVLEDALQIVVSAHPSLAAATLAHNSVVVLVEGDHAFESASNAMIPHAIFVNRTVLADPVRVAEIILHECVHQKLYDLYLLHPLLPPGYDPDSASTVFPPWQRERWSYDRAFAAAHVYVHIAAFYDAMLGKETSPAIARDRRTLAVTRAQYLISTLTNSPERIASRKGQEFLNWLEHGLHAIEPDSAIRGTILKGGA